MFCFAAAVLLYSVPPQHRLLASECPLVKGDLLSHKLASCFVKR